MTKSDQFQGVLCRCLDWMSFAEPIWAGGHVAACKGRTHDRFRTAIKSCHFSLDPNGPSTHGTGPQPKPSLSIRLPEPRANRLQSTPRSLADAYAGGEDGLHIPQAETEAVIQLHPVLDALGRVAEATEWVGRLHVGQLATLGSGPTT